MLKLSVQLVVALVAVYLLGCKTATPELVPNPPNSYGSGGEPVFVIYQMPDYPSPGRGSHFPGGLVAALWSDGRIIRPKQAGAVGASYVAGSVPDKERADFLDFLSESKALKLPHYPGTPVHAADQSIVIRWKDHMERWTRVLPDEASAWFEVEKRLWKLPVVSVKSIHKGEIEATSWSRWRFQ